MGRSYGAGHPLTLKCSKCKVLANTWSTGTNIEATGRVRPLTPSQVGTGGGRALLYRAEIRCLHCGWLMWSRHVHARTLLVRFLEARIETLDKIGDVAVLVKPTKKELDALVETGRQG